MFNQKRAASFGTIVAIFGSILIALGIAWLLAQNWHQIPATLKIIILLSATSAAYIAGSMFRMRNYQGIGKALLVLGALLYTLSIFLIAQIFFTSTSWQGTAWLLLLSWIGVLAASYIFDSSISLVVGLWEFVVWLFIQFLAFSETYYEPSFGILALCFLATGILIYGFGLLHRAKNHKFAGVYQWWTLFYFLAFTYILTFQSFLPILWSNAQFSTSLLSFLIILFVAGIIVLVLGMINSISKKAIVRNELYGFIVVIIFLAVLIGSTSAVSNTVGSCNQKQCYDFRNKDLCQKAPHDMNCIWQNNYCDIKSCYILKNQTSCENPADELNCKWYGNYCSEKLCNDYTDKISCENALIGAEQRFDGQNQQKCVWIENLSTQVNINEKIPKPAPEGLTHCMPKSCYYYTDENSCSKANCEWVNNLCSEKSCYNYIDETSCSNAPQELNCKWKESFCDIKRPCEEFSNNYKACSQQENCQWSAGYYYFYGGRTNKIPLSLWAVWIFANIIFLALILTVISYGTWQKLPKVINLGIIYFSLDIITRYIGFIMDFWGYTSLSIIFITGGGILLLGGWLIERWRRNLMTKAK